LSNTGAKALVKDRRAVDPTALLVCLMADGVSPAAVIARPIIGSVITIVIRPDDAGTINRTRLVIIPDHSPLPINRSGVIAVIIAVAIRCDWRGITIRGWSRIGLRRSAGDDGTGS